MKAVRLSRFGEPDVLEVVQIPEPIPGDGQILVRVEAAGVNYFEALMRADRYAVTPALPLLLGVEVAGVVEAAGRGAESAIGTRVAIPLFAVGASGGYAEYVAVDAAAAVPIPDRVSSGVAVALLIQGLTALRAARRYPLAGKTVLVTAAAGGVGTLLVQLLRQMGAAKIIAAASKREKLDLALSLGADIAVNYADDRWSEAAKDATHGHGIDIVYDFVGGKIGSDCLPLLKQGGILVSGALGRITFTHLDLESMAERNQSINGFALLPLLAPDALQTDLAYLFDLSSTGALNVLIDETYSLDDVAKAHRRMESRSSQGKIILVP
ncbi:quinone oxidoreductase family protein [Bradyrhizobium arachidis]|uniref:Zinc-binding alcohol dehydrogenase family protein n=1 Tax=Bradyrhizobium arachidis TaxID=858423 RepID=A0AAE7NJW7_9BRAD|nr:zinc-binding dehydrogenase [Bradyrhizobium arachidis]QOZ67348.1 zinc-binding alcohol dehydrogenase family protein [Bradyrhizobium arachidis]SFU80379.1 NADPH2:quinone reductase [Bradyrhizobium arachidis]